MPNSEEVKIYFDGVAREWDRIRQDYYGVEVINKALAAAGLHQAHQADLLIDVGCGTGFLSAGLAGYATRVVAIDDSPGMLVVAQENMISLGLHNVELKPGSVSNLPIEGGQAEAVFANMVLHHAPDPQVMVREMARVAKPGGRIVITDLDTHDKEWFKVEMADVWLGFSRDQMQAFMEGSGLTNFEFGWVGTQ
ncbi:MAG TPA: methyltransferase domain-containing protein [Chloroflexia bacterium]|nr:methyltransferase domain-containing protein [Chloroflexia bacterium]